MGRPASGLDDYLEWQQRLHNQKESGLSVMDFCRQEGFSKCTFYRWVRQLRDGIPKQMLDEDQEQQQTEEGKSLFLPVSLKANPVEIELPNGAVLRLPVGVGQAVLVEVIRTVGNMRPWRSSS